MKAVSINRRQIMAAAFGGAVLPRISFGAGRSDKRLVIVMLRGAMDGLGAVPAFGDPDYERARNGIATLPPGSGDASALNLDGFFGLSPALRGLHERYVQRELLVFHAIASPYRDRSHFDAQNLLENGSATPFGLTDGWANRALMGLSKASTDKRSELGIALAPSMPLTMRGDAPVTSWSPSILPAPNTDLVTRIMNMYQGADPKLAHALAAAAQANGRANSSEKGDPFEVLMGAAARFMKEPRSPCLAMIESTGWDTHVNQNGPFGVLPRNLASLDRGIDALAKGLGQRWVDTAVLVMTEFGRTVAMNGTGGTDHGTGGAAFLIGGSVKGGRVIADWPGLKPGKLFAGRDLKPTADLRSVMKATLSDHLGIDSAYVERVVFPDSGSTSMMAGLF